MFFFAYLASNAGAFAAVSVLYRDETKPHPIGLLAGEGRRSPFAAGVLALCLFSLAGIPATAGLIGKFFLFKAAVDRGLGPAGRIALALCAAGILALGIFPARLWELAKVAADAFPFFGS